jgi:hypothetical protein
VASQCVAKTSGSSYRLHGTHTRVLGIATGSDARWQRLTVSRVDDFIRDLQDAVWDAKGSPAGKGTMVSLYGACNERIGDLADSGLKPRLLTSRWSPITLQFNFSVSFHSSALGDD